MAATLQLEHLHLHQHLMSIEKECIQFFSKLCATPASSLQTVTLVCFSCPFYIIANTYCRSKYTIIIITQFSLYANKKLHLVIKIEFKILLINFQFPILQTSY